MNEAELQTGAPIQAEPTVAAATPPPPAPSPISEVPPPKSKSLTGILGLGVIVIIVIIAAVSLKQGEKSPAPLEESPTPASSAQTPSSTEPLPAIPGTALLQAQKNYDIHFRDVPNPYQKLERVFNPQFGVSFLVGTLAEINAPGGDVMPLDYQLSWSADQAVYTCLDGSGLAPVIECAGSTLSDDPAFRHEYPLLELFTKPATQDILEAIENIALANVSDENCAVTPVTDLPGADPSAQYFRLDYVGDRTAILAEIEASGDFSGCGAGKVFARSCGDYFPTCGGERFIYYPGESTTTFAFQRPFVGQELVLFDTLTFGVSE